MDLTAKFNKIWKQFEIGPVPVLVAVSGGVDSIVLIDLLQKLPKEYQPLIHVATVDHCLRTQSKEETKYVQQYCLTRRLTFHTARWSKEDHPSSGVEEAGRNFRYSFFKEVMEQEKIKYLLTAHHADDQAETFMMKLLRGGDLRQLQGISKKRHFVGKSVLVRPLLGFSKNQLYEYASQNSLVYFEDQTNAEDNFLRNRIRHQVVPLLKKEDPQFLAHVASYQEQISELICLSCAGIRKIISELTINTGYSLAVWKKLGKNESKAALREICSQVVGEVNERQLTEMVNLLENAKRPQGQIDLKNNYIFVKEYGSFNFQKKEETKDTTCKEWRLLCGQWVQLSSTEKIGLFASKLPARSGDDMLELNTDSRSLVVRHRREGDKLLTTAGKQKVKKIMIDNKLPIIQRTRTWVVSKGGNDVVWVIGQKKSDLSRQNVNDKIHYIVIYRKINGGKRMLHERRY